MADITRFVGLYRFLSNFFIAHIEWQDTLWHTVEHAYQAAKTHDLFAQETIRLAKTPGQAKRFGKKVKLRPDWDQVKVAIMTELISCKFDQHPELQTKLLATGDVQLVEGNRWHDNFWGICSCGCASSGQNMLGKILMDKRKELQCIYQ